MKKHLLTFGLLLFCALSIAAQEAAPRKLLSRSDVIAYRDNHEQIEEDLDALEDDDPAFAMAALAFMPGFGNAEYDELYGYAVPAKLDSIMRKNGMGSNGFQKFVVITWGAFIAASTVELQQQETMAALYPGMASMLEATRAIIKAYEQSIHPDDLQLVISVLGTDFFEEEE